jgi:uncharacterized YigZ family protein
MPIFSFQTIQSRAQGMYKEKGSKFHAFAYPVEKEEDIQGIIKDVKKEYFDARHHCFAYILGPEKKKVRAFDDGEPNHSAGDPILGQIRSRNLTDVLVVVVRYFGGVRLGVGGLITAYKTAADDALENATIIEKEVLKSISFAYNYEATSEIMRLVKEFDLSIREQTFQEGCFIKVEYKLKNEEELFNRMKVLNATGFIKDIRF